MRKASLSLSINAIVVLILAIVVMAFALPFVKDLFEKTKTGVTEQFPVVEIQADSDNPIGIGNDFSIKPGQERKLALNVYNNAGSTVNVKSTKDVVITCNSKKNPTTERVDEKFTLDSGEYGQLRVVIKGVTGMVNNDICTIEIGAISQQFFLVTK